MSTAIDPVGLLEFLLGYASASTVEGRLGEIPGPDGTSYLVLRKLGESPEFRWYHCLLPDGRFGVLKIACDTSYNQTLEREATLLRLMRSCALELDAGRKPEETFNNDLFFPELVASFVPVTQKGRQVNILGFASVISELSCLEPVSRLINAGTRIDPRSAAWILGKTLKVQAFAAELGIVNRGISGSNILIEHDQHGVVIFNWTTAERHLDHLPEALSRTDISNAAQVAVRLMGGSEEGILPPHDQLTGNSFQEFILRLLRGEYTNPQRAHRDYYQLIRTIWSNDFWPFTIISQGKE